MAPAYTTPQGKTVGLPGCWISSPVHCGQNVVHAEADWTLRLGKETKSQRRLDSRESTEYTFPQFHDDSPVGSAMTALAFAGTLAQLVVHSSCDTSV